MKHSCDACGFEFDAENESLRALACPQCREGIARPESEREFSEVWVRVGDNHHRLFYADGPKDLIDEPRRKMVARVSNHTRGMSGARTKGAPDVYDGIAIMVNGVIVEKIGAFDLPEPEAAKKKVRVRG